MDTKSRSSSVSSDQSPTYIQSPDGGWGWVVCLGSFGVNFILDGTMFCFGILFLDLLDFFHATPANTAWVGSTLVGMHMMIGPLVSLLLACFSHRAVTICGGLIASLAFIFSMMVERIELLIFTYGILGGIGFGMTYITSHICLSLYFEKKRAIATGLATSGAGMGTFVYSYMSEYLLYTYDWRGTVFILGGCLLNCVVCGAVFRPLSWSSRSDLSSVRTDCTNEYDEGDDDEKSCIDEGKNSNKRPSLDIQIKYLDFPINTSKGFTTRSCQQLNNFVHAGGGVGGGGGGVGGGVGGVGGGENWTPQNLSVLDIRHYKISSLREVNLMPDSENYAQSKHCRNRRSSTHFNPLIKKDIYFSGSLSTIRRDSVDRHQSVSERIGKRELRFDDTIQSNSKMNCCEYSMLRHVFNFALLKDPVFVMLLMTFTLWTVQSIALTFLPGFAISRGLSRTNAAMMLSIIGITNTIGRILVGLITDYLQVPSVYSYTTSLFISSIVMFATLWCDSFVLFAVCCAIFGFCMAAVVSLRTIVIADLLGIENLTHAFGVVALFQGTGFTVCPPIAGLLFEMTDNYVLPFSLVSVCYLIAACISLGLCHYVRRRNSKSFIKADITDIAEGEELTAEIKEIQIKDKNDPETKEIGEVS